MYVDNVEGEWGAFNEIVKRKESAVQTQIGTLQMQIVAEDRAVEQKTTDLLQDWEKKKPVQVCESETKTPVSNYPQMCSKSAKVVLIHLCTFPPVLLVFLSLCPCSLCRETCVQMTLPTCSPSSRESSRE